VAKIGYRADGHVLCAISAATVSEGALALVLLRRHCLGGQLHANVAAKLNLIGLDVNRGFVGVDHGAWNSDRDIAFQPFEDTAVFAVTS
jgi:hypothetical protein